jgi:hypothetical protein
VAAYNELNPVRAGLCADPKVYRYGGYAEALAKGIPGASMRMLATTRERLRAYHERELLPSDSRGMRWQRSW